MRNTRFLLLAAPFFFGAAMGASAAPHKAKPAKAKPVKAQAAKAPVTAPQAVSGGPFRDVPPNHWAAQAVETLRQQGIVRGYPAATGRAATTKDGAR